MNKNEKSLNKISLSEKEKILSIINVIVVDDLYSLDLKKLRGLDNIYRVRVGKFRIKFKKHSNFNEIIEISKRNDNTY